MTKLAVKKKESLRTLLHDVNVKNRFKEILGTKAPAFISSILTAVNAKSALRECEPQSILSAAAIAASLDLPIVP